MARSAGRLSSFKTWFASPAAFQASQRALHAYARMEQDPRSAIAGAEAALAISKVCPDAYSLLARFKARSYEEALELYEKGCDLNKLLSEEGRSRTAIAYGHPAAAPPCQGLVRCMLGTVVTLCRMGRGKEAYERMQALLDISPPLSEAPEDEIWAIAPEVVYRAKGPEACLQWLHRHLCTDVLELGACMVWWLGMHALAWTATHLDEDFRWSALAAHTDETGLDPTRPGDPGASSSSGSSSSDSEEPLRTPVDKMRSGLSLAACCCWLPHMVDMLLGDMPLPPGPVPHLTVSPGSVGSQVSYVRYCGDLWRDTPGVLDYVRRFRNTYEVFCIANDARADRPIHLADLRRYLAPNQGPHPAAFQFRGTSRPTRGRTTETAAATKEPSSASALNGTGSGSGCTGAVSVSGSGSGPCWIFPRGMVCEDLGSWLGLVDLICGFHTGLMERKDHTMRPEEVEVLRAVLSAGCPVLPPQHRFPTYRREFMLHSPLVLASLWGYGPEAVRELVKAGANPVEPDSSGSVALLVAAEHGHWRELQAVFRVKKKLGPSQPILGAVRSWIRPVWGSSHLPPPDEALAGVTVFHLLLVAAVLSPCLPCVEGVCTSCSRCRPNFRNPSGIAHGPWANFDKLVEVLAAYGMTPLPDGLAARLADRVGAEGDRRVRDLMRRLLGRTGERLRETAAAKPEQQGRGGKSQDEQQGSAPDEQGRVQTQQQQEEKQDAVQKGQGREEQAAGVFEVDAVGREGTTVAFIRAGQPAKGQQQQQQQQQDTRTREQQDGQVQGQGAGLPAVQADAKAGPAPVLMLAAEASAVSAPAGPHEAAMADGSTGSGKSSGSAEAEAGAVGEVAARLEELVLEPHQDKAHCWACGKEKDRSAGVRLQKCSLCQTGRYCSQACQVAHWPAHRPQCRALAARRSAEGA